MRKLFVTFTLLALLCLVAPADAAQGPPGSTLKLGTAVVPEGSCSVTVTTTNGESHRLGTDILVGSLIVLDVEASPFLVKTVTGALAPGSYEILVRYGPTGLSSVDATATVNACPPPPAPPVETKPSFTG